MVDLCCVRSHPEDFALRQTQTGDICILLEPDDSNESASLQARMEELKGQFGGNPVRLVHLTCQRFALRPLDPTRSGRSEEDALGRLVHELNKPAGERGPVTLTAVSLVPIHVPFEGKNVLKWCISITDELRALQKHLFSCLNRAGMQPLYREWFIPTLVTALKDLPSLEEPSPTYLARHYPQVLFTGRRGQLSRIHGAEDFEILATFRL